ncbi:MAG TPA: DUF1549 domain-containing protein [Pirellulaceae bacterium]|nr:DUF1549 domain-containing protein [Pirellulaceae bacterium]
MTRHAPSWLLVVLLAAGSAAAQEAKSTPDVKGPPPAGPKMTAQELAEWIDERFEKEYQRLSVKPAPAVDDATYLRRLYLDLQGRVPTVAQLRDFLGDQGSFKRQDYVDKLLTADARPDRYARRTSENLARVWRRMMIPASSPNAEMATQLEPWLARQFAANTPYNEFARKLMMAQPGMPARGLGGVPMPMTPADPDAEAALFQQAIGGMPENLAAAYARVFLGIRLSCAQCHDHPFTEWTQKDFWGVAAFFSGPPPMAEPGKPATEPKPPMPPPADQPLPAPTIQATGGAYENAVYTAKLLWQKEPLKELPKGQTPRQFLAEWLVGPQNPNFAATAVNRIWQYLCGRGLAGAVDELDRLTKEERGILDELSRLFVESGYDVRWLITGICKSRVYQQSLTAVDADGFAQRPLKTLLPEQVFDSLEQALSLPIAKADNGPRWSGERAQFVARMNEAAPDSPIDYKGGIPQALMLMNGKITADATSLESSRTLRAVVEAPFLPPEEKIETLYLAAVTRKPTAEELKYLLAHVQGQKDEAQQKQAYAQILWGLLNNPEFVLSR